MAKLADRINTITESQTIAMAKLSRDLQEQGHDIISLSLGEPDFVTPEYIREGAKKAIDEGFTFYTPISGFADLRKAISEKFKRENNLDYAPDQIVVSTGAKQSIANAVLCLVNPGDEVLVPAPYWVSYSQIILLAGGIPVFLPSTIETDFKVCPQQIKAAISPKTKMFIFSSPCNPTGTVYTKEELKKLSEVFSEHENIYILSDEIYEHINFIGKHESIAQFENIKERVIVVNGVSKGYAMTGWRIGYIGTSKEIAKACDKMQGQFTSGTSSVSQKAALTALTGASEENHKMLDSFKRRRDLVLNLMKDISGWKVNVPQGAFYVFPDVHYYFGKRNGETVIKNPTDLCMYLLKDAKVSLVTGEAFGDNNCVRFSYATSDKLLVEAIRRIRESLAKLK
ncbi:MAG TPA: pyridoxal phosphate-dependent aminotransferase [Bacteroidia bacterium]|nr:pyridoxal phosphate-dependent aminotransferase [Bacteroidia bacterium]